MPRKSKTRAIELMRAALFETGLFSWGAIDLLENCEVDEDLIKSAVEQAKKDISHGAHQVRDQYVLGFAFDPEHKHVLLVWKSHPHWQAGKLNGVGGSIEEGETALQAMVREFKEETGIYTGGDDIHWQYVGSTGRPALVDGQDWSYTMHIYTIVLPLATLKTAQEHETEEEPIALPLNMEIVKRKGVNNLTWIVDAALTSLKTGMHVHASEPVIFPGDDA